MTGIPVWMTTEVKEVPSLDLTVQGLGSSIQCRCDRSSVSGVRLFCEERSFCKVTGPPVEGHRLPFPVRREIGSN